jgi:DNA-binding HxlR family transcriptional regulator
MPSSDAVDACAVKRAQGSIIFSLVSDEHSELWTLRELQSEMSATNPEVLSRALENLERHGIIVRHEDCLLASRSTWLLDELGYLVLWGTDPREARNLA